jgi:hypothetical protein
MFHRIREPFGKAGLIVAMIAMVAALTGGAYAASGGLTGKEKKEVKKIAKKFAGKNGAQGPAGPIGPQGVKGDAGNAGSNGTNGAPGEPGEDGEDGQDGQDGENVSVIPLDPGNTDCPEGGTKFLNGTGEGFACNGTSGPEGGGSPTGFWENQAEQGITLGEFSVTTISFPFALDVAPSEVILFDASNHTEEEETKCPGTFSEPEATPGVLCLYLINGEPELKVAQPQTIGALLYFDKAAGPSFGSWAVEPAA